MPAYSYSWNSIRRKTLKMKFTTRRQDRTPDGIKDERNESFSTPQADCSPNLNGPPQHKKRSQDQFLTLSPQSSREMAFPLPFHDGGAIKQATMFRLKPRLDQMEQSQNQRIHYPNNIRNLGPSSSNQNLQSNQQVRPQPIRPNDSDGSNNSSTFHTSTLSSWSPGLYSAFRSTKRNEGDKKRG